MMKRKHIIASSLLLSGFMLSGTANAKQLFQDLQPASYGGAISCSSCHAGAPQTENNVTTSYGVAYNLFVNDDIRSSITTTYNTLEPFDSDGDGFSNIQEILAKSNVNISASTPLLTTPDFTSATGDISAKAVTGGAVSTLSLQADIPATALGGIVSFTSPYNSVSPYLTTAQFMFKAGGVQAGATPTFYHTDGSVNNLPVTGQNSFIPNVNNGSVDVGVTDEGVFDLYSTAVFQQEAIARYNNSTISTGAATNVPTTAIIDPYAKVSSTATISPYAQIDAYAVVDNYAAIGPYAQVGSYAYIAPSIDVYSVGTIASYAQISPYAQIGAYVTVPGIVAAKDGTGYVAAQFSVETTAPPLKLLGTSATGTTDGTSGGLHCMTTGLATQALMLLGLLATVFLVRRKRS